MPSFGFRTAAGAPFFGGRSRACWTHASASALQTGAITAVATTTAAPAGPVTGNEGSVDFTLFSGPWKKEVLDTKEGSRDDVKWLNPVVGQHKYIEAMMDCSAWNAAANPESCDKRGLLKFLNNAHEVIGETDAKHACDSREHNAWVNSFTMPLPEGTANVIAFAEGDKARTRAWSKFCLL